MVLLCYLCAYSRNNSGDLHWHCHHCRVRKLVDEQKKSRTVTTTHHQSTESNPFTQPKENAKTMKRSCSWPKMQKKECKIWKEVTFEQRASALIYHILVSKYFLLLLLMEKKTHFLCMFFSVDYFPACPPFLSPYRWFSVPLFFRRCYNSVKFLHDIFTFHLLFGELWCVVDVVGGFFASSFCSLAVVYFHAQGEIRSWDISLFFFSFFFTECILLCLCSKVYNM